MGKRVKAAIFAAFLLGFFNLYGMLSPVVLASVETYKEDLTPLYRIWRLEKFLKKYNSPLLSSSQTFIEVSEKYNLDWRFLVAISGIESTFGRFIPYQSFNPFGFANGQAKFSSFDESIETVGRYLFGMKNRGLSTPEKLGPTYTPPNYSNWISAVNCFMRELEATEI